MAIKKVVAKDYRDQQRIANAMFLYYRSQLSTIIRDASHAAIQLVAGHLSFMQPIDYKTYIKTGMDHRIERDLKNIFDVAATHIEHKWSDMRRMIGLHGMMTAGFVSRKSQPPWIPVKLNLTDLRTSDGDSWKSQIHYHFRNLSDIVERQIRSGIVKGENLHEILQRVRSTLKVSTLKQKESLWREPWLKQVKKSNDETGYEGWDKTVDIFDKPPVELHEGTFTLEDIEQLQQEQRIAMDWQHRSYTKAEREDDALWKKNKAMIELEKNLMSDAVTLLHEGALKIGTDNMGIEDFVWIVSKPQKECDECTDRDGLTTLQIEKQIDDDFGAEPPPLHPNCMCQLVPQLRDDWDKDALEKEGYEWDEDEGIAFNPNAQQKEMGFKSMSWDAWMNNVGGLE